MNPSHINNTRLRRGWRLGVAAAAMWGLALQLTGCMAPAYVAMELEKAGSGRKIDKSQAVLLHHVKTLRAAGDPLGDYFYALGNSDGWITDVQEPQAITELFRQAAAKGSMDAKILLALQKATSEPIPGRLDHSKGPRGNLVAWEAGLAELLPLLQQQCYVRRLVIGSGRHFTTEQRPYVTTYAVASDIWHYFRDGSHQQNAQKQWVKVIEKDPVREKLWDELDKFCKQPVELWLDTLYKI